MNVSTRSHSSNQNNPSASMQSEMIPRMMYVSSNYSLLALAPALLAFCCAGLLHGIVSSSKGPLAPLAAAAQTTDTLSQWYKYAQWVLTLGLCAVALARAAIPEIEAARTNTFQINILGMTSKTHFSLLWAAAILQNLLMNDAQVVMFLEPHRFSVDCAVLFLTVVGLALTYPPIVVPTQVEKSD